MVLAGFAKLSTSRIITFSMKDATDFNTAEPGVTVSVSISKNGAAFAAAAGAVTELANGWYYITLSTADTNTLGDLAFRCTGTGCFPELFKIQIVSELPGQLSASGIQSIWDALTSALTTAGSIGKKLADFVLGSDSRVKISADAHSSGLTVADVTQCQQLVANLDKTGYELSGGSRGQIVDDVFLESIASYTTAGTFGKWVNDLITAFWQVAIPGAFSAGQAGKVLGDLPASITDPWNVTVPGAYGAGKAGKILGDNLNTTVSSRSSLSSADVTTAVNTALDASSTELTAVPSDTASLRSMFQFLFQYFRNKKVVTSSTESLYKNNSTTVLGTAAVADDGSIFSKNKMV